MKMKAIACVLLMVGLAGCRGERHEVSAAADEVVDFGRRLEPRGKVVLHGAGQTDDATFKEYSAVMGSERPILYMSYVDLKDDLPKYFRGLKKDVEGYTDFVVPQIGLALNGGDAKGHYEDEVVSGALDSKVKDLCAGIQSLGRPVYLRVGYEFNGEWNGYSAGAYVGAFRRIALMVRQCSAVTALVWDFAPDAGKLNYMRYYPGDEWVDWWGVNLFSETSFDSSAVKEFLSEAKARRFPVMIGESAPRRHPVTEGAKVVEGWYKPYFELMRTHPEIKAFSYINWDWRIYKQWSDWGDSRVQENAAVLNYWKGELAGGRYLHARGRAETLKLLGVEMAEPVSAKK